MLVTSRPLVRITICSPFVPGLELMREERRHIRDSAALQIQIHVAAQIIQFKQRRRTVLVMLNTIKVGQSHPGRREWKWNGTPLVRVMMVGCPASVAMMV